MDRLAVVILVRHAPHLVPRCLDAIATNTSPTHTTQVIEWGVGDDALVSANLFRRAVDRATGPICIVHDDAAVPAGWAEQLLGTLDRNGGLVLSAATAADSGAAALPDTGIRVIQPFRELPSAALAVAEPATLATVAGFDGRFSTARAGDADLLFKLWCHGRTVTVDEHVLVDHGGCGRLEPLPEPVLAEREADWRAFTATWSGATPGSVAEADLPRLPEAATAAAWIERWSEVRMLRLRERRRFESERAELERRAEASAGSTRWLTAERD